VHRNARIRCEFHGPSVDSHPNRNRLGAQYSACRGGTCRLQFLDAWLLRIGLVFATPRVVESAYSQASRQGALGTWCCFGWLLGSAGDLRGSSRRFACAPLPQTAACSLSELTRVAARSILHRMTQEKTERSNCRFVIRDSNDGKPQIHVERYHQTISVLGDAVLGFDLLGGTTLEQAKRVVAVLNESVLDVFVTVKQTGSS
jgi:hypothetical protein